MPTSFDDRLLHRTLSRFETFMPPAIEKAQPPITITVMRIEMALVLNSEMLRYVCPVVDAILTTWNTESSKPMFATNTNAMLAAAIMAMNTPISNEKIFFIFPVNK